MPGAGPIGMAPAGAAGSPVGVDPLAGAGAEAAMRQAERRQTVTRTDFTIEWVVPVGDDEQDSESDGQMRPF